MNCSQTLALDIRVGNAFLDFIIGEGTFAIDAGFPCKLNEALKGRAVTGLVSDGIAFDHESFNSNLESAILFAKPLLIGNEDVVEKNFVQVLLVAESTNGLDCNAR